MALFLDGFKSGKSAGADEPGRELLKGLLLVSTAESHGSGAECAGSEDGGRDGSGYSGTSGVWSGLEERGGRSARSEAEEGC